MNYTVMARTNYVRTVNPEEWARLVALTAGEVITQEVMRDGGAVTLVGARWDDGEGPWLDEDEPSHQASGVTQETVEAGVVALLAPLLEDGEVLVYVEAGHEGARSVGGYAVAINAAGERADVGLYDIYEKAKALTDRPEAILQAVF